MCVYCIHEHAVAGEVVPLSGPLQLAWQTALLRLTDQPLPQE